MMDKPIKAIDAIRPAECQLKKNIMDVIDLFYEDTGLTVSDIYIRLISDGTKCGTLLSKSISVKYTTDLP